MFLKATGAAIPPTSDRKDVDELPRARSIRSREAGKLGALLAQFPASFKNEPARAAISSGCCRPSRTIRSRWNCGTAASATTRSRRCGCWASTAPRWSRSTSRSSGSRSARTSCPTCKTFYYMRLHGRNAAQWWKHDKSEDRYNYLYSADELEPFVEAAEEASRDVKKAYSTRTITSRRSRSPTRRRSSTSSGSR